MKNVIVNFLLSKLRNYNYGEERLEIIKYGLESIYIFLSKTIVVFTIAYFLNIFEEVIIFSLIYNIIRMPSFGLHASKSWLCLVSSILIFIIIPVVCNTWKINMLARAIVGSVCILLIYKNAPADTHKRPIVNKKRRENYKICSTFIAIIMVTCSLFIENTFLCNSLILALAVQCFMVSPLIYSIFKLPFNNYKNFEI